MQEKELEIADGSLYYGKTQNGIIITGFQGSAGELRIPEEIDNLPVREIAGKAFLSKKNLRKVIVPETVEEIGDWAFAYCDNLEQVELKASVIRFGKAVFLDCGSLTRLYVATPQVNSGNGITAFPVKKEATEKAEAVAALLAAAVTTAQAYYLLDAEDAGSGEWFSKWDARMLEIVNQPDEEGFSRQVLCGEEDYGSTDKEVYMSEQRKKKVRLLLLRCLHDVCLDENVRLQAEEYLRAHTKGGAGEETWLVILREHGNDKAYYQLFTELSCLTEDNFEGVIADVGEDYPEMKAFFMRYKEAKIGYTDFFGDLEL